MPTTETSRVRASGKTPGTSDATPAAPRLRKPDSKASNRLIRTDRIAATSRSSNRLKASARRTAGAPTRISRTIAVRQAAVAARTEKGPGMTISQDLPMFLRNGKRRSRLKKLTMISGGTMSRLKKRSGWRLPAFTPSSWTYNRTMKPKSRLLPALFRSDTY